jgi:hypothetical protein
MVINFFTITITIHIHIIILIFPSNKIFYSRMIRLCRNTSSTGGVKNIAVLVLLTKVCDLELFHIIVVIDYSVID